MIPVLDWSQAAADPDGFTSVLGKALRETGFLLLDGHDVPKPLIAESFAQAAAFFAQPADRKRPLAIENNPHNRGWVAPGCEQLDTTGAAADSKEAFNIGLDLAVDDPRVMAGAPFRGINIWPDLAGFRETMLAYFSSVQAQGVALLSHVARDLGLERGHFDHSFRAPLATLRLLRYPAGTERPDEIGAGAHTDYGALTLLMTDDTPGLQVHPRDGDWQDVPHRPGAFVVNIGDCLMRWTNDLYISTPHRVLPPPRPRQAIAFFLDPDPDAVIAPLPGTGTPRYPPVTGADYLRSRLDATYSGDAR